MKTMCGNYLEYILKYDMYLKIQRNIITNCTYYYYNVYISLSIRRILGAQLMFSDRST